MIVLVSREMEVNIVEICIVDFGLMIVLEVVVGFLNILNMFMLEDWIILLLIRLLIVGLIWLWVLVCWFFLNSLNII